VAAPEQGGLQFWLMLRAVAEGWSGSKTLDTLRFFGLGMRTQQFYRLWATARAVNAEAGLEPTRPLDQAPTLDEMPPVATNGPEGVLQTVRLIYRERVTGNMRTVYHSTKSDQAITRQEAIANAIDAYATHSEDYQTDLVAAVHTSAIQLVPVTVGL
jgi:hypothetical protein